MARNIEIKARIASVEAMRSKVAALADHGPIELLQDDTFFTCERGRLKLRALSANEGQLIFYQRANHTGPKESFFVMASTSSPDTLRVEELGHFLELEVVLSEGEPSASGVEEAHKLMAALGVAPTQLIEGAYVDLLAQKHAGHRLHGVRQPSRGQPYACPVPSGGAHLPAP
jgi:adenylate cyclase class IV